MNSILGGQAVRRNDSFGHSGRLLAPGRSICVVESSNDLNEGAGENPRAIEGWGRSQGVYTSTYLPLASRHWWTLAGKASPQSIASSGPPAVDLVSSGSQSAPACIPRRRPLGLTLAAKGRTLAKPCSIWVVCRGRCGGPHASFARSTQYCPMGTTEGAVSWP